MTPRKLTVAYFRCPNCGHDAVYAVGGVRHKDHWRPWCLACRGPIDTWTGNGCCSRPPEGFRMNTMNRLLVLADMDGPWHETFEAARRLGRTI